MAVGKLRPCGENDIRNLVLEPKMPVLLGAKALLLVILGVSVFAEPHLIVVVLWEEGTVKLGFDYLPPVYSGPLVAYYPGMDIHFDDRGVGLCPILITRTVVTSILNRVGRVLVKELLDGISDHDDASLGLEENECIFLLGECQVHYRRYQYRYSWRGKCRETEGGRKG